MKSKIFLHSFITLVLLLCFSSNSLGQERISVSAGFGILEFANVGLRYQIKQSQIGFSVGTATWNDSQVLSVLGDGQYTYPFIPAIGAGIFYKF